MKKKKEIHHHAHPIYHPVIDGNKDEEHHVKHKKKPKVSWKLILFFILAVGILLAYYNWSFVLSLIEKQPTLFSIYSFIKTQVDNRSYLGMAIVSSISGLFFIVIPIEPTYLFFLSLGKNPLLVTLTIVCSFILGLCFSYLLGLLLGKRFLERKHKSKLEKLTKITEKYGALFLLIAIMFFLPVPFIVFVYGALRYNFRRMVKYLFIGFSLKFVALFFLKDYVQELIKSLLNF